MHKYVLSHIVIRQMVPPDQFQSYSPLSIEFGIKLIFVVLEFLEV